MRKIPIMIVAASLLGLGCGSSGNNDSDGGTGAGGGTSSDANANADDADGDMVADTYAYGETDANGEVGADVDSCVAIDSPIAPNPVNILIVLDRSRSMLTEYTGAGDYQSQSFAKITTVALKEVVAAADVDGLIHFGLSVFPAIDCKCDDEDADTVCDRAEKCWPAEDTPLVAIGETGAHMEIASNLDAIGTTGTIGTCGGTPIYESLASAQTYLSSLTDGLENFVLLATDGVPNCIEAYYTPDSDNCTCTETTTCTDSIQCLDDKFTYNQAAQLAELGIPVFVIGIGEGTTDIDWATVMNTIAQNGGTDKYYPATDPTSLKTALQKITGKTIACSFEVNWDDVPEVFDAKLVDKSCDRVRVYGATDLAAGTEVSIPASWNCSNSNGWRWSGLSDVDPTTPLTECSVIELCPGACDALRDGAYEQISARFGCSVIIE